MTNTKEDEIVELANRQCKGCDGKYEEEHVRAAIRLTAKSMKEMIKDFPNPYPRDLFLWDNKEDMKITRGRFNEFIHLVVENVRQDLIKEIKEEWLGEGKEK